jgi:hypothetical protein
VLYYKENKVYINIARHITVIEPGLAVFVLLNIAFFVIIMKDAFLKKKLQSQLKIRKNLRYIFLKKNNLN